MPQAAQARAGFLLPETAFRSCVRPETTTTMSAVALTSSTEAGLIRAIAVGERVDVGEGEAIGHAGDVSS